jgi:hypothetical protein
MFTLPVLFKTALRPFPLSTTQCPFTCVPCQTYQSRLPQQSALIPTTGHNQNAIHHPQAQTRLSFHHRRHRSPHKLADLSLQAFYVVRPCSIHVRTLRTSRTYIAHISPSIDVDLTADREGAGRKYPAPPTGHDLMAMFPPPPPTNLSEVRPTSGYFQRQERAFFAQAGKEIVRVKVEIDLPPDGASTYAADVDAARAKATRSRDPSANGAVSSRSWPPNTPGTAIVTTPHAQHRMIPSSPPYPHHTPPMSAQGIVPPPVAPALATSYPGSQPTSPLQRMHHHSSPVYPHPHHLHDSHHTAPGGGAALRNAANAESGGPGIPEYPDDYSRDDPDEAWRRPIPYAERRRAGKHTRRVIVRTN